MYRLEATTVPTARLTVGGMRRWAEGGRLAASYRCLIKRRLRRECAARSVASWLVLTPEGEVLEVGKYGSGGKA